MQSTEFSLFNMTNPSGKKEGKGLKQAQSALAGSDKLFDSDFAKMLNKADFEKLMKGEQGSSKELDFDLKSLLSALKGASSKEASLKVLDGDGQKLEHLKASEIKNPDQLKGLLGEVFEKTGQDSLKIELNLDQSEKKGLKSLTLTKQDFDKLSNQKLESNPKAAKLKTNQAHFQGSEDFIKNFSVNEGQRAAQQAQRSEQSVLFNQQNHQQLSQYARSQQEASQSMFEASPRMFQQMAIEAGADSQDGLSLAQKSEDSFMNITPKGQGFQMESSLSRQLAPQATITGSQNTQTIDLSHIDSNNKTELINKLMSEIEKGQFSKKGSLDLFVKHNELGNFRVNVNKAGLGQQIDLQIQAQTREAHEFFSKNEVELLKSLDRSGVKVSEFRLMTGTGREFSQVFVETKANSSNSSESGTSDQKSEEENAQSEQEQQAQQDKESQKRQALWEKYREGFIDAA